MYCYINKVQQNICLNKIKFRQSYHRGHAFILRKCFRHGVHWKTKKDIGFNLKYLLSQFCDIQKVPNFTLKMYLNIYPII